MNQDEKEMRRERGNLHVIPRGGAFTRASLSERSAYAAGMPSDDAAVPGSGPAWARIDHCFDPETIYLRFHGSGEPGDACMARVWGLEADESNPAPGAARRPARIRRGRYLCTLEIHLCEMPPINEKMGFSPNTRFANWVDVVEDMAPMPGVWSLWKNKKDGVFPEMMFGGWGFVGYLLEMALVAPPGYRPMTAAGAMWRSYTHGPILWPSPDGKPYTALDWIEKPGKGRPPPTFHLDLGMGADDGEGEEWKKR